MQCVGYIFQPSFHFAHHRWLGLTVELLLSRGKSGLFNAIFDLFFFIAAVCKSCSLLLYMLQHSKSYQKVIFGLTGNWNEGPSPPPKKGGIFIIFIIPSQKNLIQTVHRLSSSSSIKGLFWEGAFDDEMRGEVRKNFYFFYLSFISRPSGVGKKISFTLRGGRHKIRMEVDGVMAETERRDLVFFSPLLSEG